MELGRFDQAEAFTTQDGSTISEVAGQVSLPTARPVAGGGTTVPAGSATDAHYHAVSEEIYFFTSGSGRMRLGEQEAEVVAGDCVVIPPGVEHKLWASERTRAWCCSAAARPRTARGHGHHRGLS